jgi:predicted SnoaL-like aldol condensation-catalyzing enzyme
MVNDNLVVSPVHFTAKSGHRKLDMTGVDLFEVKDGKITQVWLFSDDQVKEDEFWN